jgi:hypothetical protein
MEPVRKGNAAQVNHRILTVAAPGQFPILI